MAFVKYKRRKMWDGREIINIVFFLIQTTMSTNNNMRAILIKELGMSFLNKLKAKANTLSTVGDASQLYLGQVEKPVPKATEVLVRVSLKLYLQ